ncbi:MAG TPA: response regulator [Candidatus Paceibacterota bacterium]|nr:response regulator [Verrucomicrobiota bacterium]HSA12422.1 response regulator [Candidatus Paceibacterota bacterium]
MNQPIKVLLIEDSADDAALLKIELQRAGFAPVWHRVETREELVAALDRQEWDLIIADYRLPRFDGLEAMTLVRERGLDLPFIVVSGFITEETAVAAMKAGAHDYVMKDKLARLGPAVERELRDARVRRERRRSELQLRAQHTITLILATTASLDEAVPAIVQALLDSLQMDLGALWTVDPQQAVLKPTVLTLSAPSPALNTFLEENRRRTLHSGASLAGRVWEQRRAIWVVDLAQDTGFLVRDSAARAGLQSATAFPIQSGGNFFGVLEFFALRRLEADVALLNMMTAISSEIGQFLQRRNAEEALRRAHDELETRVLQRTAELKTANDRLEAAIAERRRLEFELLEITEKERRRIGLDLHDDLGQQLSGLALMTKGLELKLGRRGVAEAADAARIHKLVQQAMSHARDLAQDLATLDLKREDLTAALKGLARHASDLFKVSCEFKAEGTIPNLETDIASQLYKIAQEAVTNAIKHGKAKQVGIGLANGAAEVVLTIHNDGLPFPKLQGSSTGMGLRIMNYRANLIGASFEIKASGSRGTRVICSVPIEKKK